MGHMYLTVAVLAFILLLASILAHVFARQEWVEEQQMLAIRRELSRHKHPSQFDDDWTPPHGIGRP